MLDGKDGVRVVRTTEGAIGSNRSKERGQEGEERMPWWVVCERENWGVDYRRKVAVGGWVGQLDGAWGDAGWIGEDKHNRDKLINNKEIRRNDVGTNN